MRISYHYLRSILLFNLFSIMHTHTRARYVSGIYAIVEMVVCVSEKRHKVNNLHFHSSHLFLYCLVACLGVGQGDRSPITAITAAGGAGTFHFRAKKTTNAFPNCAKHRHKNTTHTSTYIYTQCTHCHTQVRYAVVVVSLATRYTCAEDCDWVYELLATSWSLVNALELFK